MKNIYYHKHFLNILAIVIFTSCSINSNADINSLKERISTLSIIKKDNLYVLKTKDCIKCTYALNDWYNILSDKDENIIIICESPNTVDISKIYRKKNCFIEPNSRFCRKIKSSYHVDLSDSTNFVYYEFYIDNITQKIKERLIL